MKKRKKLLCIGLAISMIVGLTACGSKETEPPKGSAETQTAVSSEQGGANGTQTLTMTFALAETSPHYEAALKFAELVEEYTDGAYKVEVYPNSSLAGGNQLSAIEMVQKGTISCGLLSPYVQCAIEPNLNAFGIPYLWKDYETIDATLKPGTAVHNRLNEILANTGYIAIAYAENGYREITNSIREIRKPEDLKGIKFRVLGSNMLFDYFSSMGANPMDMNFGELFTGLQQGAVDGQENPIPTAIIASKFYEVQDYCTVWGYCYEPHPLMFNLELWNSFDAATQEAIQKAAVEACDLQRELSRNAIEDGIKTMEEAGTRVTILTDEEKEAFKAYADPIVEKYSSQFDQELFNALLEANQ